LHLTFQQVITHHSGHDYAKMIRGDPAVEGIFCWNAGKTMTDKCVPKTPGAGVHLITGPVAIEGAMPGDVLQVEILELDPRPNPATGKTYGTNSAKFAGYQFRVGKSAEFFNFPIFSIWQLPNSPIVFAHLPIILLCFALLWKGLSTYVLVEACPRCDFDYL
jgi:acetamidase/formamidase